MRYIYTMSLFVVCFCFVSPPPLQAEGGGAGPPLENSNFLNLQQNYQKQALDPLPHRQTDIPRTSLGKKNFWIHACLPTNT